MKKLVRVGVILLFLVGTLVYPNESCRVLIKGKEENVLVFQTLQKAPEPPPGNPKSHTPGGPGLATDATNSRAFAGRAMAPPHVVNPVTFQSHGQEESVLVLQTLQKAPERSPGNPKGYTPSSPKLVADATNTRAFVVQKALEHSPGNPKAHTPGSPKSATDTTKTRAFTVQKALERPPGNPGAYTPGSPKPVVDTTNTRAFAVQKAPERPPGNHEAYTPGSPRPAADTTNTRAFAVQKPPKRPSGNPKAYTPGSSRPTAEATNTKAFTVQKALERPPGNPVDYTPGSPGLATDTTNTKAFAGQAMAPPCVVNPAAFQSHGKEESVLVLQTLQKAPERPPGNPKGYTPSSPRLATDTTDARAFAGRAMAPPSVVNPVTFQSHGAIANCK
ncbi:hypothetical protein ACJRO7_008897 [Eucalyptus globulus]|uniref:Uncharacterized protein n=1 Tax=Eucalyptus globulus TaxID=34317 RepID=A0ABD3ITS9_EUCGL